MFFPDIVCYFANNKQICKVETKTKCLENRELLAVIAKAMGHPTRLAILKFLASQNSCVFGDIHEKLPIAKATVSQHLKELKKAGLIQGEVTPPKVHYCINKENWLLAQELFEVFFTRKGCCDILEK